ncbi:hypothetical protein BOTBODRAFT_162858 [Botryobasidium botryosum FD-172 SS1]|uniref:AB hydrolase-1 domain-containing protein n=1 Tax=Botryobasidium botryosum (strain FD-172 SS1) TaxID=930990 RepID=A0A067MHI4_BOTB1|nr:hypothetical protein BOTBODRAFT_162858 [Botryobasidium botryosum FD-172 SS1]
MSYSVSTITLASGVKVFYRHAGSPTLPTLLLLHGFPSSSFQYRNLIPFVASTGKYHVIAPDLPGFGFTEVPEGWTHGFEGMKEVVKDLLDAIKVEKFAVYIFDYGSPTAFRLALERPSAIAGIITQSGNAYDEGFGAEFWAPLKRYWADPNNTNREALRFATGFDVTKWQYTNGAPNPEKLQPEAWHLDAALMAREGNADIQLDLFKDYGTNQTLYPTFHKYLRDNQPPVLAIWGKNDTIFIPPGAEAFKRDVKDAEVKFVDAGHFALESHLEQIGQEVIKFLDTKAKF